MGAQIYYYFHIPVENNCDNKKLDHIRFLRDCNHFEEWKEYESSEYTMCTSSYLKTVCQN